MEIATAAELAPEHRELAEIAAVSDEDDRPDVAELLPVDRFGELLELLPQDALVAVASEEEIPPALARMGDLAVIETAAGLGLAVVGGPEVLAPRPDLGLAAMPLTAAITAFKV